MQVSTMFVSAEAKPSARGTIYRFKEASGGIVVTNEEALAAQAQQLLNQPVTAEINEVTSTKVNPHSGRPYINRYLNAIAAGAAPGATFQTATPSTSTGGFVTQTITAPGVTIEITARDRSIWSQSASKVAAHLLAFFPESERTLATFDTLVKRETEKYAAAHKGNLDSAATLNGEFASHGGGEVVPPHTDDDIPF